MCVLTRELDESGKMARSHSSSGLPRRKSALLGVLTLSFCVILGYQSLAFVQAPSSSTSSEKQTSNLIDRRGLLSAAVSGCAGILGFEVIGPDPAEAQRRVAYPPIDKKDKKRCRWRSSAFGQANAQRDKLFDVRECKLSDTQAGEKDMAGMLMGNGEFRNVNFTGATLTKAVANNAVFDGSVFTNAIIDRATFDGSSMKGVVFKNTLLTGSTFENVDLTDSDFTDAYVAEYDIIPLCKNPTMKGTNPITGADTFTSAGCDLRSTGW
eukprot:TRINITY_DN110104_c0_g1_i1.p1 TRINITY_DN110104_c0_g1~~TRINITY_DN110104_c0_g1_i1.p1  ORF type:complete len:267 (-),score=40.23 TRINITY_DN110104_c0_g1_i1:254-1054(-)